MLKGTKAHTVYAYIHKQKQILNDANKLRSAVELNKQRDTVFTVILYLTVLCRLHNAPRMDLHPNVPAIKKSVRKQIIQNVV